jgi:hypothetical protein
MKSSLHTLISFLPSPLNFDCHLKRLSQFLSQPALDPRYTASGRPQQKTPFPNIPLLLQRCVYFAFA